MCFNFLTTELTDYLPALVSAGSEKDREWPLSAVFSIKKQTEKRYGK